MFEALQPETVNPIPLPMPKKIKVLLMDDSEFDRQRIRRLSLQSELPIELEEVDGLQGFEKALAKNQFDVLLLDYRLPVGSGIQALDLINKDARHRHAAKIMITGANEVDVAVQAMQEGCHDYLNKDALDVPKLHKSMTKAIAVSREWFEQEQKTAHQREVIKMGLASALKDSSVQETVSQLIRSEFAQQVARTSHFQSAATSSEMDALIVELFHQDDDDEFVFH